MTKTPRAAAPSSAHEQNRIDAIDDDIGGWRRWGPYLSERSWGTVREDYSPNGDAWRYLTHDQAVSKAYRWGDDGIAGICDRYQLLIFAPAFWNGQDRILKERLFGVTPYEGNHGEDVKEYYFHSDNTPSHSYMRYLYKYPQEAFPYEDLVRENQRRQGRGMEYELLDTGIFDGDRYFDIVIEYAKATPEDICIRITCTNRGPDPAPLLVLPHLWYRNRWSWRGETRPEPTIHLEPGTPPHLMADDTAVDLIQSVPVHYRLGPRYLDYTPGGRPVFTDNESNTAVLYGTSNRREYLKDGFHRYFVDDDGSAVNPRLRGTKAAIGYAFEAIEPDEEVVVRLRLSDQAERSEPLAEVDSTIDERRAEADAWFTSLHPDGCSDPKRDVQRQAWAGLLWTKQSYLFDVSKWLDGDNPSQPPDMRRRQIRNGHWRHLNSLRVMSMPDKWEYPWFAAWDLAFHTVPLARIDPAFAKDQLWMLLFEQFQHPNGQIPAYEWEFSDLNPPVHAWAVWRVYNMDRIQSGKADRDFLECCFHKLLMNFAWWVNKVDREGNNIFEGGFLGLDNITVVDRSEAPHDGSVLEQADATGWMGMFCLNLMRIALELARENQVYEGLAIKFFQHYAYIASAMKHMGSHGYQLWDDEDGFFYDVLRFPDGTYHKFRVRSVVGLIPLFVVERLEEDWIRQFPRFAKNVDWFLRNRPEMVRDVLHTVDHGDKRTHVLTVLNRDQIADMLERLCREDEFLSPFGIRSLSKCHADHPFELDGRSVRYEPAEAESKLKGGNSNWRGPVWFPMNFLLIESLRKLGKAFGPDLVVRRTGGDVEETWTMTELAGEIANRLVRLFLPDAHGDRPIFGGTRRFQDDPLWRDHLLFFEYFHAENGAGLGASHQTGWTALVASLIDEWDARGALR